eukprot:COSAG02_NODE_652_length_18867_cov_30.656756_10_plen_124_part_00
MYHYRYVPTIGVLGTSRGRPAGGGGGRARAGDAWTGHGTDVYGVHSCSSQRWDPVRSADRDTMHALPWAALAVLAAFAGPTAAVEVRAARCRTTPDAGSYKRAAPVGFMSKLTTAASLRAART